ncbi:LPXTG cell wall anchor domain-containing protein [Enterococcus faecalis]|uniref:LPXTG cell wall anchor domain-containing protein n=1 Tax=Enterococcus faecalis TaxID=1351 RepID=UPI00200C7E29|nr:LPXTG cell wall anchor domain-containing protein [Enterococcus faecalis]UQF26366.1 LPXTG cell wall anchor domain-containing protein [Enterococcus faecalis]UQR18737.1 LPXTG cell wall anchor domain-containing protein [Enterococcus faecalis]WCG40764.1 LPXTG cell wall anchor domain-containing protein [Enterococcus faecalis]WCG43332.1 LPXTG cell wall anchor domain-containing protein [Enterococcus faecalis]WCG51206.1 LPXTG cell wall anchor domain-containing protein [Enterococcus faecalis]
MKKKNILMVVVLVLFSLGFTVQQVSAQTGNDSKSEGNVGFYDIQTSSTSEDSSTDSSTESSFDESKNSSSSENIIKDTTHGGTGESSNGLKKFLPSTGTSETYIYTIMGVVFICLIGIILMNRVKRRNKDE